MMIEKLHKRTYKYRVEVISKESDQYMFNQALISFLISSAVWSVIADLINLVCK